MSRTDRYHGVLALNKPVGISSHDAVLKARRAIGQARVGHTGTLDPHAGGLLVLCLGKATKAARFLSQCDKTYEAEIHLGLTSTTYDAEGVDLNARPNDVPSLTDADIRSLLSEFEGKILQKVPEFSAVRVHGTRLYELARKGKKVDTPVREISISRISMLSFSNPFLRIRVECSKGTYIRSLAQAIGERVGCGGYLSALTRIAVGNLDLSTALTLEQVEAYHKSGELAANVLTLAHVLDYGAITVSTEFSRQVVNGPLLRYRDVVGTEGTFAAGDQVFLKDRQGSILAIGTAEIDANTFCGGLDDKLFSYERVLN